MRLYFLRHGQAGERDEYKGNDFDRPLTDEGRERMAREAKTIAQLQLAPDLIITSPLVRAKQTAEIVAERLKMRDRLIDDERLGLDFGLGELRQILQEHANASALLLVGHDPSMSQTVGQLVGGARINLKKGSLAYVDLPDASSVDGVLVWLIPPKVLTL
ncbi:MAG: phosphohistidine phosphatase SixA [Vulcanimicrobiaceae bacterium]